MSLIRELINLSEAQNSLWKYFTHSSFNGKVPDFGKMSEKDIEEFDTSRVDEDIPGWAFAAAWALGAKNLNELAFADSETLFDNEDFANFHKHFKEEEKIKQYYSVATGYMTRGKLEGIKAVHFHDHGFAAYVILKKNLPKKIKEQFVATGDHETSNDEVWVLVTDPNKDETYHGINVVFDKHGKVKSASCGDTQSKSDWEKHKDKITKVATDFAKKHDLFEAVEDSHKQS